MVVILICMDSNLEIHFDYLSFTFPLGKDYINKANQVMYELCQLFNFDFENELHHQDYTFNNYNQEFIMGVNVRFRYGGEATKMKVVEVDAKGNEKEEVYYSAQLELKGSGCREIEAHGFNDYIALFRYILLDLKGRATRCDIAIDDKSGDTLTQSYFLKKIRALEFTSIWKGKGATPRFEISEGTTVYLGSDSSDRILCVYDKKAERIVRHENFEGDYWIRFEMRFFKQKAAELSYFILDNELDEIGAYACELLRGMIDLKKPSKKDTNKSRWESDATWLLFLNNVQKTKFSVSPKRFSNVERKMSWRDYSMTRMNLIFDLADAYCRDEHGNDWMDPTIARAVHEMEMMIHYFEESPLDANDLALINQYRFNHTMTLLSLDDVYKKMDEMKKRVQFLTEKFTFPF